MENFPKYQKVNGLVKNCNQIDEAYSGLVCLAQGYCKNKFSKMDIDHYANLFLDDVYNGKGLKHMDKNRKVLAKIMNSLGFSTVKEAFSNVYSASKKFLNNKEFRYTSLACDVLHDLDNSKFEFKFLSVKIKHAKDFSKYTNSFDNQHVVNYYTPTFSNVLKSLMMYKVYLAKNKSNTKYLQKVSKPHFDKFMKTFHKFSKKHDEFVARQV